MPERHGTQPGGCGMIRGSKITICCCVLVLLFSSAGLAQTSPYRDARLPVEQRMADLLSRMTLEEKVAQLEGAWENAQFHSDPKTVFIDPKGAFLPENAAA